MNHRDRELCKLPMEVEPQEICEHPQREQSGRRRSIRRE